MLDGARRVLDGSVRTLELELAAPAGGLDAEHVAQHVQVAIEVAEQEPFFIQILQRDRSFHQEGFSMQVLYAIQQARAECSPPVQPE